MINDSASGEFSPSLKIPSLGRQIKVNDIVTALPSLQRKMPQLPGVPGTPSYKGASSLREGGKLNHRMPKSKHSPTIASLALNSYIGGSPAPGGINDLRSRRNQHGSGTHKDNESGRGARSHVDLLSLDKNGTMSY